MAKIFSRQMLRLSFRNPLTLAGHPKQGITEGGALMQRSSCLPASHPPVDLLSFKAPLYLAPPPLQARVLSAAANQPHQETLSLRTTTSREEAEAKELGLTTCPHPPPPSPTLSQASTASTTSSGTFEVLTFQNKLYKYLILKKK